MTPDKLRDAMTKLEFNTNDIAVLMGVTRRTPQLWLAGHNPIPQSCALVLLALLDGEHPRADADCGDLATGSHRREFASDLS